MVTDGAGIAERWPLPDHHEARDALLRAYGEPGRRYHNLTHLTEVLDRLDELSGYDAVPVRLAAWFHDGVYDGEPGAEERSATWAEAALADTEYADEVARLVRLTERHDPEPEDANGAALCDADLAILAADPARYAAYTAAVREEYAHVSDPDFRAGRAAILGDLLAAPTLFRTAYGRAHWEPRARATVSAEIDALLAAR